MFDLPERYRKPYDSKNTVQGLEVLCISKRTDSESSIESADARRLRPMIVSIQFVVANCMSGG